jgi:alpha-ketoglutarate-dependent 2,4-dichlorophenoxyacetate dioxygenase
MLKGSTTIQETRDLVYQYTNRGPDGRPLPSTDPQVSILKNNEQWHTDATYSQPRPGISIFTGRVVPEEGANTEFCDTRVLFEGLPVEYQQRLRKITALHSIVHGLSRIGRGEQIQGENRDRYSGTKRPLVYFHKESGRYALCLAHYIAKMEGMSDEECEQLRLELTDVATRPDRVYSHKWRAGDMLIWDNRCTMHRGTPFDSDRYLREMWTIRTVDVHELRRQLNGLPRCRPSHHERAGRTGLGSWIRLANRQTFATDGYRDRSRRRRDVGTSG